MRRMILLGLVGLGTACGGSGGEGHTGRLITNEMLCGHQIVCGTTTLSDLKAAFGEPDHTSAGSGFTTLQYWSPDAHGVPMDVVVFTVGPNQKLMSLYREGDTTGQGPIPVCTGCVR